MLRGHPVASHASTCLCGGGFSPLSACQACNCRLGLGIGGQPLGVSSLQHSPGFARCHSRTSSYLSFHSHRQYRASHSPDLVLLRCFGSCLQDVAMCAQHWTSRQRQHISPTPPPSPLSLSARVRLRVSLHINSRGSGWLANGAQAHIRELQKRRRGVLHRLR